MRVPSAWLTSTPLKASTPSEVTAGMDMSSELLGKNCCPNCKGQMQALDGDLPLTVCTKCRIALPIKDDQETSQENL